PAFLFRYRHRNGLANVGVFFLEPLDPSGAVNQLLFSREEGMAVGTDFQMQNIALESRSCLESVATRADYGNIAVLRLNARFHETPSVNKPVSILTARSITFNLKGRSQIVVRCEGVPL